MEHRPINGEQARELTQRGLKDSFQRNVRIQTELGLNSVTMTFGNVDYVEDFIHYIKILGGYKIEKTASCLSIRISW